jgi:hypothetical protein
LLCSTLLALRLIVKGSVKQVSGGGAVKGGGAGAGVV